MFYRASPPDQPGKTSAEMSQSVHPDWQRGNEVITARPMHCNGQGVMNMKWFQSSRETVIKRSAQDESCCLVCHKMWYYQIIPRTFIKRGM